MVFEQPCKKNFIKNKNLRVNNFHLNITIARGTTSGVPTIFHN